MFSGAQGEYAGLRAIKAYLEHIEQPQRTVSITLRLSILGMVMQIYMGICNIVVTAVCH